MKTNTNPTSTTTHTPGPWHMEKHDGAWEIWPKDNGQTHSFIGRIMRRDDARLIAAAPELLEALEGIAASIGLCLEIPMRAKEWREVSEINLKFIGTAIAKARGQP